MQPGSEHHVKNAQTAQGRFRPVHVARNRRDREAVAANARTTSSTPAVVRRASNIAIHDGAERRARHSARRDRNRNAGVSPIIPSPGTGIGNCAGSSAAPSSESSIRRWRDFRKRAAVVHRQQHSFVSPALVVDGRTCRGSLGSDRDRQCRNQPSRARCPGPNLQPMRFRSPVSAIPEIHERNTTVKPQLHCRAGRARLPLAAGRSGTSAREPGRPQRACRRLPAIPVVAATVTGRNVPIYLRHRHGDRLQH